MIWHTRQERKVIKKYNGKPRVSYGYDGTIRGRPVEVRSCRKDNRYRIQKNTHRELVRRGGSYIFCAGSRTKRVPARKVSAMLGRGKWYKDRKYPHRFIRKKEIFGLNITFMN